MFSEAVGLSFLARSTSLEAKGGRPQLSATQVRRAVGVASGAVMKAGLPACQPSATILAPSRSLSSGSPRCGGDQATAPCRPCRETCEDRRRRPPGRRSGSPAEIGFRELGSSLTRASLGGGA